MCQESWGAAVEQDPSQAGFYSIEIIINGLVMCVCFFFFNSKVDYCQKRDYKIATNEVSWAKLMQFEPLQWDPKERCSCLPCIQSVLHRCDEGGSRLSKGSLEVC